MAARRMPRVDEGGSLREREPIESLRLLGLHQLFKPPHFYTKGMTIFMRTMQFMCCATVGISHPALIWTTAVLRGTTILFLVVTAFYCGFLIDFKYGFSEGLFVNVVNLMYTMSALYCLVIWRRLDSGLPLMVQKLSSLGHGQKPMRKGVKKWTIISTVSALVLGLVTLGVNVEKAARCSDRDVCMVNEQLSQVLAAVYKSLIALLFNSAFCSTVVAYTVVHFAVREAISLFNEDLKRAPITVDTLRKSLLDYERLQGLVDDINEMWGLADLVFQFLSVGFTATMFFLFMRAEGKYHYFWLTIYFTYMTVFIWIGPVSANTAARKTYVIALRKLCHSPLETPRDAIDVLKCMKDMAQNRPPVITSGGAFEVGMDNIKMVLTGMIIYMICLLQIPAIKYNNTTKLNEYYGMTPFWRDLKGLNVDKKWHE